jgi:rubrerythrin
MATVKKRYIRKNKVDAEISPIKVFESSPGMGLPVLRCKWCNAEWIPRKNFPVECPSCKRRGWYDPSVKHIPKSDFED